MSKIQERIKEIDKSAKRSRLIAIILSVVIIGFVIYTGYLLNEISETNDNLTKSEISLKANKVSLEESNTALEKKDSILTLKNKKLLELRGSLEKEWNKADASGKIKDYASYLERAIEDDDHYSEALQKMNTLANDKGYVQITDSNGTKYLEEIENLNTDDVFYRVKKAMSVRFGVIGDRSFSNTGRTGNVIDIGDVVKIINKYTSGGAEWAEIRYDK